MKGISYDDIMLGVSITRNQDLANVFYRLTLIEAYGTGLPKILRCYENLALKPKIETSDNAFKITLPNANIARAGKHYGNDLSNSEQAVLSLFSKKDSIIRKDVEILLEISQTMATRILKEMINKGVISVVGKGKNTRYSKT